MKLQKTGRTILLFLLICSAFFSDAFAAETISSELPPELEAYSEKSVACTIGSIDYIVAQKMFPDAELQLYNSIGDALIAVSSGKADFTMDNRRSAQILVKTNPAFAYIDVPVYAQYLGYFVSKDSEKGQTIREQLNAYIETHAEEIERIIEDWTNNSDAKEPIDMNPTGKNGIIKMGVIGSTPPYSTVKNGQSAGSDVEIMAGFCKEYDYALQVETVDLAGLIPAVQKGKLDIGGSGIAITEERMQSVDFTTPYVNDPFVLVIRSEEAAEGIVQRIAQSFRRTFVDEDRWKLIAKGTLRTVIIVACAAVPGTALGLLLYLLYRKEHKALNKIIDFLIWLSGGLPVMTILLILYYVIFGKSSLSADMVAVIGLGFILCASVCSSLTTAVQAVSRDQIETAYSLGFNDLQTLFGFVLPQSMRQFVPNYCNHLVQLIHSTAIVGYISVQDLTKISDLIRSITYEAFFPIIASALIYLVLDAVLVWLVRCLGRLLDPRHRTEKQILRKFES